MVFTDNWLGTLRALVQMHSYLLTKPRHLPYRESAAAGLWSRNSDPLTCLPHLSPAEDWDDYEPHLADRALFRRIHKEEEISGSSGRRHRFAVR